MRVYSWNMLYRNTDVERAFAFIRDTDFDIFCLQEVPEGFLARLRTLPYAVAVREDREARYHGTFQPFYLVTLSRYPIVDSKGIAHREYWHELPWRTRAFVNLMPDRYFTRIRNRGALVTDLSVEGKRMRVYNLHLILARPAWRTAEFDQALAELDPTLPSVVCGDLNTIESWHMTPLNWILGGTLADALLAGRERIVREEQFARLKLSNPLRSTITHPASRSQLDHILVSPHFTVQTDQVLDDGYGSDHLPISVTLT